MQVLIQDKQACRRLDRTRIKRAARKILSLLKHPSTELSILFVDDEGMTQLNAAYRGIKKTTDVLSFEASIDADRDDLYPVIGDVVINIQMVSSAAGTSFADFYLEIYRLLIHGILHLTGYEHEGSKYNAMIMRKKEQEILNALKKVC
ncbi:MAG: rRNA maturation RNase YbeY [Nitrospirae bacterium]|nr:rRNA maturation RNase YbeY [Nitrospirota bacterium]